MPKAYVLYPNPGDADLADPAWRCRRGRSLPPWMDRANLVVVERMEGNVSSTARNETESSVLKYSSCQAVIGQTC